MDAGYVLYRDRPDWRDVTPVPQDDGPNPIVAISYSEPFQDVFDYFRAVLRSGEKTERVLELTSTALKQNPANYTVWKYRRDVLDHLKPNLRKELVFLNKFLEDSDQKNFQVWHHRRLIVQWMGEPAEELDFTAQCLDIDGKNYHVWQHRQWVVLTFKLFDNELDYVDTMLEKDVRNNSAWSHRHFIIVHSTGYTPKVIEREVEYALDKIKIAPSNESSWSYLRGVMIHTEKGNLSSDKSVMKFCLDLYNSNNRSAELLGYLVDMGEELMQDNSGTGDDALNPQKLIQICNELAEVHDRIRRRYWNFIAKRIERNQCAS